VGQARQTETERPPVHLEILSVLHDEEPGKPAIVERLDDLPQSSLTEQGLQPGTPVQE
jgi:hypothetical protein